MTAAYTNSYQNALPAVIHYHDDEAAVATGLRHLDDIDESAAAVMVQTQQRRFRHRILLPVAALLVMAFLALNGGGATAGSSTTSMASVNLLGSSSAATAKASGPPTYKDQPDYNDPQGKYNWQKCLDADDDGCWKDEGKRVGSFWKDFGQRMETFWNGVGDWFKNVFHPAAATAPAETPVKTKKAKIKKTKETEEPLDAVVTEAPVPEVVETEAPVVETEAPVPAV